MTFLLGFVLISIGLAIGYAAGRWHYDAMQEMEAGPFVWEYQFMEYVQRHMEWSKDTFGYPSKWGADAERLCRHIEKELNEIRKKPLDCEEWIDVIILAIDGAWRAGHSPLTIAYTLQQKQAKNLQREWVIPKDPLVPIEHDRMEERETNP